MEKRKDKPNADNYLKNEKPFTGEELLSEIFPLLEDYFECKNIGFNGKNIEMEVYNGQTFSIKAEEK